MKLEGEMKLDIKKSLPTTLCAIKAQRVADWVLVFWGSRSILNTGPSAQIGECFPKTQPLQL